MHNFKILLTSMIILSSHFKRLEYINLEKYEYQRFIYCTSNREETQNQEMQLMNIARMGTCDIVAKEFHMLELFHVTS